MTIYSTRDYVHSVINVPSQSHATVLKIKLTKNFDLSAFSQHEIGCCLLNKTQYFGLRHSYSTLVDLGRKVQNLKFFFHYCNTFYSEWLWNRVILDENTLAYNPSYPKMYDIECSMIQKLEHVFVLEDCHIYKANVRMCSPYFYTELDRQQLGICI
jgi:hypothetical protein